MNLPFLDQLGEAIDKAEASNGTRVIIIRGAEDYFSAGVDLTSFITGELVERFGEHWRENLFPLTNHYQSILNKVEKCSLPVIALLQKYCLGLGLELALACDFRIAAEGTRLGLPEARIGLIPDVGGTTRLTRIIGPARAKEYIMTGKEFDLGCAEQWGLVNYVVPEDQLMAKGEQLAQELSDAAPLAVSYAKKIIDGMDDIERGLRMEAWAQAILMNTEDVMTGAQAALTKQKPQWKGK
jgi:enoyl-CoA hydratase/carnithine racemase